ncbi:YsnF/AvaK domain-containing protein [Gorillibacterium sp. sgz5001074]|uniref:YsnF/AvaK domain-containing protein n=1 Tax=Gorillibacterium sp. sgz5001074 TaxID=3446695 RepID=UPI003F67D039
MAEEPIADAGSRVMKLREEKLDIGKERIFLADVQVRREWVEDTRRIEVPLYREELVVEKNGHEAYRIPVREERLEVRKIPVELNEVRVRTETQVDEVQVQETLLKEVARLSVEGEADLLEKSRSDA